MASQAFVIVGAGLRRQGGGRVSRRRLRRATHAYRGRGPPALRAPPLSKDYLAGKAERDSVFVHDQAWYRQQEIALRLGRQAVAIDRAARQVRLDDGDSLPYDKLLITTGSSPRRLADASGVHYLRTIDDSDRLQQILAPDRTWP